MTDSRTTRKTRFHLMIAHPHLPRLLFERSGDTASLPCVTVDDTIWWRNAEVVNREVSRAFGHDVSVLHCLSRDDDREPSERIYLFEFPGNPEDVGGAWLGEGDLARLTFSDTRHGEMVERTLKELGASADPDLRPPWSRPGWLSRARRWFEDQLEDLDLEHERAPELIYSWPLAAVLHVETSAGENYMKASSTLSDYVDEPLFTERLAGLFPDRVPRPIRTNAGERWMLLPDLGYPIREAPLDVSIAALKAFCELQVRSIDRVDELRSWGCPDRGLERLAAQVDLLSGSDPEDLGLQEREIDTLRRVAPRIHENIERLSGYDLPPVLSHGDLFTGNIARVDGEFVFFDWALMSVSHPLLDLVNFVQDEELAIGPEAFAGAWCALASMDRLTGAWRLAWPLAYLKFSIDLRSWSRCLKPEPEEFPECVTNNVRSLIACFEDSAS